jgi:opacity protein-like surface antigen
MKILLLSFSFLVLSLVSAAQGLHLNLFLGTSNYQGDLQDKIFSFDQAHLAGGIGLSYDLSKRFSVRANFKIGKISADDEKGRNKARNLNFTSQLTEGDIDLQYFITTLGRHSLTPYVFAGIALYHFDPYTFDSTGQKYYLKPFSTEGEGFATGIKEYNLTQVSIPFGAGVKMPLSDNINVGLEVGFRKLFTDYLDDVSGTYIAEDLLLANRGSKAVELAYRGGELKGGSPVYPPAGSQRGNSKLKDWYYFTGLTLSFRLLNGNLGGSGKEISCPRNVF